MPAPKPGKNEATDADDPPMTREEWLAYHVARAPRITRKQWADTLLLLHNQNQDNHETDDMQKAS